MMHARKIFRLTAIATLFVIPLAACAASPDPEQTLDQLTSVTEPPAMAEAPDEFDFEVNPEPLVEPLECLPYLVITARGTGEPSKGQLLSPVARAISDSRPDQVATLDLDYPADEDVKQGSKIGARILIDTLNVQVQHCPDQRFILLGYSQGALIIGDALVPPEQRLVGENVGEVFAEAIDKVLAIVLYANPRFTAGESFNTGDFSQRVSGLLPRLLGEFEPLSDRMRDYCSKDDFVCQSNGFELDPEGHIAYYDNGMQSDGAAYVITRLDPLLPVRTAEPAD